MPRDFPTAKVANRDESAIGRDPAAKGRVSRWEPHAPQPHNPANTRDFQAHLARYDAQSRHTQPENGGESGIRTHGTLPYTRFPSVRLQPLGHLSGKISVPVSCGRGDARVGSSRRGSISVRVSNSNSSPLQPADRHHRATTTRSFGELGHALKCGGEGGIRTLDRFPYTPLAGARLQPLGHLSAGGEPYRKEPRRSAAPAGFSSAPR